MRLITLLLVIPLSTTFSITPSFAVDKKTAEKHEITVIHIGDIHGHLTPRPNVRSDGTERMEGGLARMKTKIDQIRSSSKSSLLINTGDTIQGSGEALFTRGQALVDVVDLLGVDAFAPGNWEWVYGKQRFIELFVASTHPEATTKAKRWGAIAGNVYHKDVSPPATILPPTLFKMVGKIKVGIIGCTTNRGPQVVGNWVTKGLTYTDCSAEVKLHAAAFRQPTRTSTGAGDPGGAVDLVILASEIEIGRNIQLLKQLTAEQHVDIVFSSDMHEEVSKPIRVKTAANLSSMIVEQGMDGTALGEMKFGINSTLAVGKKIVDWKYKQHRIDDSLSENAAVKKKVDEVRKPYTKAGYVASTPCNAASPYWNLFSETCLHGPLDVTVGVADVHLHRSNFSHEPVPAALEGSSHNWVADAMRWWSGADMATVRGFRYGTTIKAGKITRNDLYHFVPIGPRVAKVSRLTAVQLRNQLDNSSRSVFGQDPNKDWHGGWLFAYSAAGFSVKFDPYSVSAVDNNPNNGNPLYAPTAPGVTDPFAGMRKPSRARDLTVKAPCHVLPAAEQTGCVGSAVTHITNNTDGNWSASWNTAFTNKKIIVLTPGNNPEAQQNWKLKPVDVTKPFQAPMLSAAGYWYQRLPETINNCPNCTPAGLSDSKILSADTPYLLPVNANTHGKPSLDANGIPVVKVYPADVLDDTGKVLHKKGEWVAGPDGKPQVEGRTIDLIEILEKYLAAGNAKPSTGRVSLWNNAKLPDHRSTLGFPVMQPLCGTIGRPAKASCP